LGDSTVLVSGVPQAERNSKAQTIRILLARLRSVLADELMLNMLTCEAHSFRLSMSASHNKAAKPDIRQMTTLRTLPWLTLKPALTRRDYCYGAAIFARVETCLPKIVLAITCNIEGALKTTRQPLTWTGSEF